MTTILNAPARRPAGLAPRASARDPARQTMRAFVRTLARLTTPPRERDEEGAR